MDTNQTQPIEPQPKKSMWTSVTPFSKYLALILFVALPFIGAWAGYFYAPEKIIETQSFVTVEGNTESEACSKTILEPAYNSFMTVCPGEYDLDMINKFVQQEGRTFEAIADKSLGRLNEGDDQLFLVRVAPQDSISGVPYKTLVYNKTKNEFLREEARDEFGQVDKWFRTNFYTRVHLERAEPGKPHTKVVFNDYRNDRRIVLYEETELGVDLMEMCESKCFSLLETSFSGDVIFGRYDNNHPGNLIEVKTVKIPEEYWKR